MKSLSLLPRNITACMSESDKRALSRNGKTPEESRSLAAAKSEREIQGQIANYLRLLRVPSNRDAMHRKRTGTVGWPDFVFPYRGHFVAWEVKCPWSQNLRPEQSEMARELQRHGTEWRLITSIEDARQHLREMDARCD